MKAGERWRVVIARSKFGLSVLACPWPIYHAGIALPPLMDLGYAALLVSVSSTFSSPR